jgi:hypothetical protein
VTRTRRRFSAAVLALALLAAACGEDREETAADPADEAPAEETAEETAPAEETTEEAPAEETTEETPAEETTEETPEEEAPEEAPAGETFGDLAWPCGPAAEPNTDDGSEPGVTADTITIGTGDDAGFVSAPGLNHEMVDAVNALVVKCNELGGINGRQITANYYDAKIFEVGTAIQAACDDNVFFLVGQGWAFDSNQEEIRLGCGLPSAPTYTVSAAFAHGPNVIQGVPNPADETPATSFIQFAELFPDAVTAMGVLAGNFSATRESRDRVVAASADYGWTFVSTDLEYNTQGEADWTPFVLQLQEAGIKGLYWVGSCLPNMQLFIQTAKANGLDIPIYADANSYEAACAAANEDGALDNVHMRMAFTPFEEAADNKATQDYLDIVNANGGDVSLLGMQATSSFMLWATAAASCGPTLTRQCTLDYVTGINEWTAGGLHTASDPGGNHPPECGAMLKLEGTTYVRVAPAEAAGFDCPDNGIAPVVGVPALEPLELDENRISQQFVPEG